MSYHLGLIAYQGHCSTAAIFKDNLLIAAMSEERCSRIKEDSSFPTRAIETLIKELNIEPSQISHTTFAWSPQKSIFEYVKSCRFSFSFVFEKRKNGNSSRARKFLNMINVRKKLKVDLKIDCPILFTSHHECHALSSIFHTNWTRGLAVVFDGAGDDSTISVYHFKNLKLNRIHKEAFPNSIGIFYSAITQLLGFRPDLDEYKVMGLAAYGTPKHISLLRKLISINGQKINLNMDYFLFDQNGNRLYSKHLKNLFHEIDINDFDNKADIAASTQKLLEEITILFLQELLREEKDETNICFSGGVFQNCKLNQRIRENFSSYNLFFSPLSSDLGTSVGACAKFAIKKLNKRPIIEGLNLGPSFSDESIINATNKAELKVIKSDNITQETAEILANNRIVAWFQGKSELGPRALGFRSILANPSDKKMQDRVNQIIKDRELFRPFAPAVLDTRAKEYFHLIGNTDNLQYMIETVVAKKITQNKAPAIVHIDGTSRIQLVSRLRNPLFFDLIERFSSITSVPILLNTSFNSKDEPIINTPDEAISFFKKSKIDNLVINNYIISKD